MAKRSLMSLTGLGKILDKDFLTEGGLTMAGGLAAAAIYGQLVKRIAWFNAAWKRGGLALVIGAGAGRLLWDHQRDAAKGVMGAMGAVVGGQALSYAGVSLQGLMGLAAGMPESMIGQPQINYAGGANQQLQGIQVQEHSAASGGSFAGIGRQRVPVGSWL